MYAVVVLDRGKSDDLDEDPSESESDALVLEYSQSRINFHPWSVFFCFLFRTLVSRLRFRVNRSRSYTTEIKIRIFEINEGRHLSVDEQNFTLDKNFYVIARKVNASSPIARVPEIARFFELEGRQHSVFKLDAFAFRPIRKFFLVQFSADFCSTRSIAEMRNSLR